MNFVELSAKVKGLEDRIAALEGAWLLKFALDKAAPGPEKAAPAAPEEPDGIELQRRQAAADNPPRAL